MALTNRDRIGRGFELLAEGLAPFVENHIRGIVPGGVDWLTWLSKSLYPNNPKMKVSRTDPLILLRAIIQEKDAFKVVLSRSEQSYAQELWECRNNWAHNAVFDEADTRRLLDTMSRLLRAVGATFEAEEVRKLLKDHDAPGATEPRDANVDVPANVNVSQLGKETGTARSLETVALVTVIAWVALSSLMIGVLPSSALTEKAIIVSASLAVAIGAVTGYGALHNIIRFTAMAVAIFSALVLLAALSIVATSQAQAQRAKENVAAGQTATNHPYQPANTPSAKISSPSARPETSVSGTMNAPRINRVRPLYLSSLTGSPTVGDAPEIGSWSISGINYPYSVGFADLCISDAVTFQFAPLYQYFVATVGVADGADPNDQNTPVDFEVDTGSGTQYGSRAQYGRPASIKVKIVGLTSITLSASNGDCFMSNHSVAVWGGAELTPLPKGLVSAEHASVFNLVKAEDWRIGGGEPVGMLVNE